MISLPDRSPPDSSHRSPSSCVCVCSRGLKQEDGTKKDEDVCGFLTLLLSECLCSTEQDLPCLQKPRSYQGQSLILDSGSMCRNGHSLLLHSPVRVSIDPKCSLITLWVPTSSMWLRDIESTNQIWSRSSIQASWSCRTRGETRTGPPSCTTLWASAYTPLSSLHWCDGRDTSHLGGERYISQNGGSLLFWATEQSVLY